MSDKIEVRFTRPQWNAVLVAIYKAEVEASNNNKERQFGVLVRAEHAMREGLEGSDRGDMED
jgi:hypothetical protein